MKTNARAIAEDLARQIVRRLETINIAERETMRNVASQLKCALRMIDSAERLGVAFFDPDNGIAAAIAANAIAPVIGTTWNDLEQPNFPGTIAKVNGARIEYSDGNWDNLASFLEMVRSGRYVQVKK